ncbi:ABI family, member 3a isoform X2 [Antennarius striatus]|uniref:ABI family, member 3a isoform X2 n=1 Tax=Antennarius striatus TaxID=241820 RepID=UPI0035B2E76C
MDPPDLLTDTMKENSFSQEVMKILEEVPDARKALLRNYDNLLNVAEYCYDNYVQSGEDSSKALEDTKNFTTQSLASVAYQISTLANSVLSLLDAQTNQLLHMESSINLIGQTVDMHKEKVSRREIGVFTAVRRVPRSHKILPPPQPPDGARPRPLYSRRPINYQQLDHMGHGVKVSGKQSERTGTIRKHGASIRSNKAPEPVQCPMAPPAGGSSFGKPVAPPTIPQAPPECDIIATLLDDTTPPTPATNELSSQDNEVTNTSDLPPPPPAPDSSGEAVAPPPPPPPPPPSLLSEGLIDHNGPPQAPPLILETANDSSELPALPPPPPPSQDDGVLPPGRICRRRLPPTTRSLSLRVRSGPASRCRNTRSLFLPVAQSLMIPPPPSYPPPHAPSSSSSSSSRLCLPARLEHLDLEILAPPPPLLLDDDVSFDGIMPALPPPVDADAPPQYLEKVVALYHFEASKPEDLSLTEGDVIYLTRRHDDGWCEGFVNGNRGFFPGNYVQSCD